MKRTILGILTALFTTMLAPGALAADVKVETDADKTLYTLGLLLSQRVSQFHLTEAELEIVKAGLTDGVLDRTKKCDVEVWGPKVNDLAQGRAKRVAEGNKAAGKAFIDKVTAEDKSIRKTASGIAMKTLIDGIGATPAATATVKVHYRGTLIDGTTEFDSSYKRNEPATFALTRVVACWTEGLQLMKVGGKARFYCPSDIAYGDQGRPGIPPGATLVFEIELLDIVK